MAEVQQGGATASSDIVAEVATRVLAQPFDGILRVAVDGPAGVGKTTFADQLSAEMRFRGHHTIRASIDGFHNRRAVRYRLGRSSPEGFYRESYDYAALKPLLLEPLSPGGSRLYRTAAFDHWSDRAVEAPVEAAPERAVLIFDGVFLQRRELRPYWDVSIYLDAPDAVTFPRGAGRGPGFGSADPDAPSNRRYVEGQALYLAEAQPLHRASLLIDYSDFADPKLVR